MITVKELEKRLKVTANLSEVDNQFDLSTCFLRSALVLQILATEGIATGKIQSSMEEIKKEIWNEHLIVSFYLYRHSLELALKALIIKSTNQELVGHDLEDLWKKVPPDYKNNLSESIDCAFDILRKYKLIKNEELFRYFINKDKKFLKNLPKIKYDDFNNLLEATLKVRNCT